MKSAWILLLLILAAALPVIIAFSVFRVKKYNVSPPRFLLSLVAGIISLFAAALLQNFFPSEETGPGGLPSIFFGIFIRVALIEELSRIIILFPLFKTGARYYSSGVSAATAGLTAGLGFAMIENASYGIADMYITLTRIFTAAPLHGACGIRAGVAVFIAGRQPAKALFLVISSVLIHGAYNLTIVNPALPSLLAIPIAFTALFGSLHFFSDTGKIVEQAG